MIKTLMYPLDSSLTLEMVIEQEMKFRDTLRVASVTVKGKDPISASCVVWLTRNGYIQEYRDNVYHTSRLKYGMLLTSDLSLGATGA